MVWTQVLMTFAQALTNYTSQFWCNVIKITKNKLYQICKSQLAPKCSSFFGAKGACHNVWYIVYINWMHLLLNNYVIHKRICTNLTIFGGGGLGGLEVKKILVILELLCKFNKSEFSPSPTPLDHDSCLTLTWLWAPRL